MYFDFPTLRTISLIITIPLSIIVTLILAFTSLAWWCLAFLFGIPLFCWVMCGFMEGWEQ